MLKKSFAGHFIIVLLLVSTSETHAANSGKSRWVTDGAKCFRLNSKVKRQSSSRAMNRLHGISVRAARAIQASEPTSLPVDLVGELGDVVAGDADSETAISAKLWASMLCSFFPDNQRSNSKAATQMVTELQNDFPDSWQSKAAVLLRITEVMGNPRLKPNERTAAAIPLQRQLLASAPQLERIAETNPECDGFLRSVVVTNCRERGWLEGWAAGGLIQYLRRAGQSAEAQALLSKFRASLVGSCSQDWFRKLAHF